MRKDRVPAMWPGRLRWRLRGATLWPLFVLLTLGEAVLVVLLPISGNHTGIVGGLLLAMFLNLIAVAGVGRVLALWVRRRRPDLPAVVAEDRAGTAVLVAVAVALLAGGIVHAPARHEADRAEREQRAAVRAFVRTHGDAAHRANLASMDTEQEADDLFRTCVPGDAAAGVPPLCLLVRTDVSPPDVRIDADRTPNRHG